VKTVRCRRVDVGCTVAEGNVADEGCAAFDGSLASDGGAADDGDAAREGCAAGVAVSVAAVGSDDARQASTATAMPSVRNAANRQADAIERSFLTIDPPWRNVIERKPQMRAAPG
jgi:hypothetical protein